jgi:hypothetical protein
MSKKLLTVTIESITVFSNGDVPGAKPASGDEKKNNAVVASLKYPRSGAPEVVSGLQFDLTNNESPKLDLADFFDSGLFKEEVQDETILQIKVTDRDVSSKAEKVLLSVLSVVFSAGLGIATGGLNKFLGAVTGFGIDSITGSIKGAGDESIFIIGQTDKVRLEMDKLPADQPLRMNIALTVPKEVRKPFFVLENGQEVKKELVLAQGIHNGNVVLRLTAKPV